MPNWSAGSKEMKALIIWTVVVICGLEYGGMAYDKMSANITADMQQKIAIMQEAREY